MPDVAGDGGSTLLLPCTIVGMIQLAVSCWLRSLGLIYFEQKKLLCREVVIWIVDRAEENIVGKTCSFEKYL